MKYQRIKQRFKQIVTCILIERKIVRNIVDHILFIRKQNQDKLLTFNYNIINLFELDCDQERTIHAYFRQYHEQQYNGLSIQRIDCGQNVENFFKQDGNQIFVDQMNLKSSIVEQSTIGSSQMNYLQKNQQFNMPNIAIQEEINKCIIQKDEQSFSGDELFQQHIQSSQTSKNTIVDFEKIGSSRNGTNNKIEKEEYIDQNEDELDFEAFNFSTVSPYQKKQINSEEKKVTRILVPEFILNKSITPQEVVLLNGEIILSFEIFDRQKDPDHDKVSFWNKFRPISQVTIKQKIVEVTMHKSSGTLNNFEPIIQRLMNMSNKDAYDSANMLQQHYNILQQEQLLRNRIVEYYQNHIHHLQWKLEENFRHSKEMAYFLMDQLPEDAYYLYSIRRTDPVTFDSIFCTLGYSKPLIRIIAGNEQNYQNFCLRSGLAEIFNGQSRQEILLMNLLFRNKVHISITTLDDYTIPIEIRVHYQKLIQTEILPGIVKEDYLKIYQILIDQRNIDELSRIRGTDLPIQVLNHSIYDQNIAQIVPPDLKYIVEANNFISKFYSDTSLTNQKKKNLSERTKDYTSEFQRIFGNQNEGQNYLKSVFNTKFAHPNKLNISQQINNPIQTKNINQNPL